MLKFILNLTLVLSATLAMSQQKTQVMVMEIREEIDPRMLRQVKLALDHAKKIKADLVIIDMDTYGGGLTDAKEIADLIMNYKKPIWVYINSDAASAGALISIACDSIYMTKGASIGAATVVEGNGQQAPDKYQSYMRSIMRSTAEANHRNPHIAEGMVDDKMVIDSIKQAGKVITFATSEAIKYGFCEAQVASIEEILARNKITNYELHHFHLSTTEKIIAIFLNPFISSVLILIILGGIYFELQTPGVGFPLVAAITALVLYLVPYYLSGLAEYWEIIVLFIGIVLLLTEIFIIPGFGIAGIAGITLVVVSMVLIMLNNDYFNFEFVPMRNIMLATLATLGGIFGGIFLLFFGGGQLTNTHAFKQLSLNETQESSQGFTVNTTTQTMMGKQGIAFTILRPSGKVLIENQVYDALTRGEFIEKGDEIEVIGTEGITLRVKKVDDN